MTAITGKCQNMCNLKVEHALELHAPFVPQRISVAARIEHELERACAAQHCPKPIGKCFSSQL
jgi:hypothetical protein